MVLKSARDVCPGPVARAIEASSKRGGAALGLVEIWRVPNLISFSTSQLVVS